MTLARLKTSHCRPARPAARDQVTQAQARKGISKEESPARGDRGRGGAGHAPDTRRKEEDCARNWVRARLRPRVVASGGGSAEE